MHIFYLFILFTLFHMCFYFYYLLLIVMNKFNEHKQVNVLFCEIQYPDLCSSLFFLVFLLVIINIFLFIYLQN
jgi:hypothetical protein